ncbi:MAG: cadmium-translocating P-type ATPase, partial [Acidobacteriia bacterium]|nr:cadmium-translocating P-type ATPase [Terriglobia bacterium]
MKDANAPAATAEPNKPFEPAAKVQPEASAAGRRPAEEEEHDHPNSWRQWAHAGFVAFLVLVVWSGFVPRWHGVDLLALAGILIGAFPILKEAIVDLAKGRMTMELSMTIALVAASVIGEFRTALVITLFVLVAEILEEMTVGKGRRAIKSLLDLLPQAAEVRADGRVSSRALSELRAGDVVLVRPGGHIPADGLVISGHSFVDQAAITGESLPVEKTPDSKVFAGTTNHSGVLEIQVERVGRDTAFGRIIEAVERAERSRAPIQRIADRLSGYLVYFALACAALTYLITRDARSTISVIVVPGACGIAAGTPLAILGGIGRAARYGAIIKGGLYLEILGTVDTIVLDKTGTLTLGTPKILEIVPSGGATPEEIIRIAATAERFSEHPLAKAITGQASEWRLPVGEPGKFRYVPGKGIICEVDGGRAAVGTPILMQDEGVAITYEEDTARSYSEVMVALNGRLLGAIHIVDVLRTEAASAMREMKAMKCRTVVLTGDRKEVGTAIAASLGVDEVDSELLPEEKVKRVRELRAQGRRVAMVGDGINDAPALVEANVGVAMGSGTDVARESASVVLLGNDLLRLTEVLKVARRCRGIILTN